MKQDKLLAVKDCVVKGKKYKKGEEIKADLQTASYLINFGYAEYEKKQTK